MSPSFQELKVHLSSLPQQERAELAEFLWSLDQEADGFEDVAEAEIDRRIEEIRSGKAVGIPAETFFAELRARER